MKVAQICAPKLIKINNTEMPKLNSGELLIKVKSVGICGTDLKLYDGTISYLKEGSLELPHIPGHEWVGEVVEAKDISSEFKPGDRVTGKCHIGCGRCEDCYNGRENICKNRIRFGILQDGSLSEYITFSEKAAYKIPQHVTDEEAVLIEPLTIALYSMDRLENIVGSTILISGLGPIGLLVSKIASKMGAGKVIGVDVDSHAIRMGKNSGCDELINLSIEKFDERVNEITKEVGPEIIVEATGSSNLLPKLLNITKYGGQISLIGMYNKEPLINANLIITKDIQINGNMASARVWQRAINLLSEQKINVNDIITHRYPKEEIKTAFQTAHEKKDNVTKVLIDL